MWCSKSIARSEAIHSFIYHILSPLENPSSATLVKETLLHGFGLVSVECCQPKSQIPEKQKGIKVSIHLHVVRSMS